MMIIALGTVIMVSGLLQDRFWDYYENGFMIITGAALRLLRERFQIITGMVSDYYGNGFRLLRERFQIITRTLLERFDRTVLKMYGNDL